MSTQVITRTFAEVYADMFKIDARIEELRAAECGGLAPTERGAWRKEWDEAFDTRRALAHEMAALTPLASGSANEEAAAALRRAAANEIHTADVQFAGGPEAVGALRRANAFNAIADKLVEVAS